MRFLLYIFAFFCSLLVFTNKSIAQDEVLSELEIPTWTYDEDYTGQEDWGAHEGYEICRNGFSQSPVNVGYTKSTNLPALISRYKPAMYRLVSDHQSLIAKVNDGGKLVIDKKSYPIQRIEIHSPSEHRIKDFFFPAEIHIFHKNLNGVVLGIAIFANVGDQQNSALQEILKNNDNKKIRFKMNASDLLPKQLGYYSYKGSLPYPPCTENIEWRILKTPISISQEQLGKIGKIIGRNSRLPQPLYVREVLESN